jgi:hypothetical protein
MYEETSNWENEQLQDESAQDWKLAEDMEAFMDVKRMLESETYRPSASSIQIILEHSRKTAPVSASC